MKDLNDKVLKFLKNNKINYLKSYDFDDNLCLSLPYRIEDRKERIIVTVCFYDSNKKLQIGFSQFRSKTIAIEKLVDVIFELNPRLIEGSLSYEKDNDKVRYVINVDIDKFIRMDNFNKYLQNVFSIYYLLIDKEYIVGENVVEEQ